MSLDQAFLGAQELESSVAPPRAPGIPGKSTLTSRLSGPSLVLRVADPATAHALGDALRGVSVQRETDGGARGQRDANGVAGDAEQAVDAARGSSGSPLRGDVRERFESSLGADLSGVRVHTGAESQAASAAVGAKAYTVGNDIHFGAGQYQPDDPFGMHLIAHEVAHTVQQSGGAQRRQHKLAVSTPGDAAEVEADRAADAMVSGAPTSVGSVVPSLAREPAATPAAPAAPATSAPMTEDDKTKAKRPKLEGQTISAGVLPEFGGNLGFSWKEGATGKLGFSGQKEKKIFDQDYGKQIPLGASGLVGELKGKVGVSASASSSVTSTVALTEAPGPHEESQPMLTVGLAGSASLEAKATGSLKLGAGVGAANLLSITGGGMVGIEAKASISITPSGEIENFGDQVNGAVDIDIKSGIEVKAVGGVYIDLNYPGDTYNIYQQELGEAVLGTLAITGGARVTGEGGLTVRPIKVTGELAFAPPVRDVQKRPATAAERARLAAQHPQEGANTGASGNRAGSATEENPEVAMSDEELWNGGNEKARSIITGHLGETVPCVDPNSGGATVRARIGGNTFAARVGIAASTKRDLAEHGKAIDRVTSAQLAAVRNGVVYKTSIMDGTSNTVDQVAGRILAAGGFEVDLVNPQFDTKDAKMETCKK